MNETPRTHEVTDCPSCPYLFREFGPTSRASCTAGKRNEHFDLHESEVEWDVIPTRCPLRKTAFVVQLMRRPEE